MVLGGRPDSHANVKAAVAEYVERGQQPGQVLSRLIAADDLDGVAARYRQRADGAGHVNGADDADATYEVSCPD
ncbi:MAG: hypothetical protein QOE30_4363 [Mycobacterium sp.]|nr:hypothetical protein [Mycobacterium sp.]